MYVCLCKGITDRQIKAAINDGAHSMSQLRKALGVASQCGKCGIATKEILMEHKAQMPAPQIPLINGFPQFYALA